MATDSALADFFQACGCTSPLLVEVADSTQSLSGRHVLKQPFALIGREPRADVVSECDDVSRQHACLQVISGQVFCLDLNSRTGTHWSDGARQSGWISPSSPIRIGTRSIRVGSQNATPLPAVAWNPLESCPQSLLPSPPLTLQFLNGDSRKSHWQVDRALTLMGSGHGCKVRLRGRNVAPLHCYVVATPKGAWIVDLLISAGVFHNGNPVRFAQLQDGDRLSIGGFQIQARFGTPASVSENVESSSNSETRETGKYVHNRPSLEMPMSHGELQTFSRGQALPIRLPVQGAMVPSEGEGAGLVSVMNQFSLMQMQMFEQFQQTMLMMFQMFGTLQQDQMATLRHELDRVHDLTRELQALKETLASTPRVQPDQPPPPTSTKASPKPAERNESKERTQQTKPVNTGYVLPTHSEHSNGAKKPADSSNQPAAATTQNADGSEAKQPPPGQDMHAWLNQRMESLQEERQSRWEKILGLLGGGKKP